MKFLAVFALAVACASADVSHVVGGAADAAAQVLRFENDVQPDGNYNYAYETSNGISASASGSIKDPNSESPVQVVQGSFKHVGPDGVAYEVTYVADENGFQPQGAHLPVAPEVPEAILRSLEYNAAHPQAAEKPFAQPAPFAPSAPVVSPVYKPQTYKPQVYKPQAYKPQAYKPFF